MQFSMGLEAKKKKKKSLKEILYKKYRKLPGLGISLKSDAFTHY